MFCSLREEGGGWKGEGRREREGEICLVVKIFAEDSGRRCAGSWLHRGQKAMAPTGIESGEGGEGGI